MNTLGRLVKRERLRRGLRGTDLGVAIGRDAAYISRLENGILKEVPPPDTVAALAETLQIPEADIVRAIGYGPKDPAQSADPAPDDPLAALVATFSPRQREMLLDLLDQANARALEDEAAARTPKRQEETP